MTDLHDAWLAKHRARFLRHDAHRWIRHDMRRFLPPEYPARQWCPRPEAKGSFNPDQPRVPKGNPDGGQWAATSASSGRLALSESQGSENNVLVGVSSELGSIRRRRPLTYCDEIYRRDIFQCKMVGLPACYAQAMVRYAAC